MILHKTYRLCIQEGQHPLTGQRAANFRLLANQWAQRRLATQWRHGCHDMRRSVCNAGASNAGRFLCVQISRERSYPLPIWKEPEKFLFRMYRPLYLWVLFRQTAWTLQLCISPFETASHYVAFTAYYYCYYNHLTALCPRLLGWASTRRNIYPPTILIII